MQFVPKREIACRGRIIARFFLARECHACVPAVYLRLLNSKNPRDLALLTNDALIGSTMSPQGRSRERWIRFRKFKSFARRSGLVNEHLGELQLAYRARIK